MKQKKRKNNNTENNLSQKVLTLSQTELLTIIGQQMERVEKGCEMIWNNQKSKPWSVKNILLSHSYIAKQRRAGNAPLAEIQRDHYYNTSFINDMGVMPYEEEKSHEYNSGNQSHKKRLCKLLFQ